MNGSQDNWIRSVDAGNGITSVEAAVAAGDRTERRSR